MSVQVVYEEITITYDENRNVWLFTLRGRDRSAESLAKAKEFIDKRAPEKKADFKPIEAWLMTYRKQPEECVVTGVAEGSSWSSRSYVWVRVGKDRSKQQASDIYPKNDKNNAAMAQILQLNKQVETLEKQRDNIAQHSVEALTVAEETAV